MGNFTIKAATLTNQKDKKLYESVSSKEKPVAKQSKQPVSKPVAEKKTDLHDLPENIQFLHNSLS